MSREIALWWTLRKILFVLVLLLFLIFGSMVLEAASARRNVSEDTVSESVWDWLTTLGKSPQAKKNIKAKRRFTRDSKRAGRERRIREKKLQRENELNIREEKRMRQARFQAQRKKIAQKKRQIEKEKRMLKKKLNAEIRRLKPE